MNSKWQANKIGLVNFWYYDLEEFYFIDGRMLLRGSNGSGKSVTMQSFIPLLLDGNIRPERLDPFGSRARKMENYLLEENDSRDERTGYLYMEFKRLESDVFITIGMGLRARKNKKLETWYFILNDGRRMNEDFYLYKEMGSKVPLTKIELKNRIAEGGVVYDTQIDYMAAVNRHIFEFETLDEYKEMIDLLIQLRTPKLSKDYKPSVINEILSNSLQMLSEDDLRPMSEAIENMDGLKTNVDILREGIEAAKTIEKIYNRYNIAVLHDKAKLCVEKRNEYERIVATDNELKEERDQITIELAKVRERLHEVKTEQEIRKREEESLNASDATRLKSQELELEEEIVSLKSELKAKGTALEKKIEERLEVENKQKKEKEHSEILEEDIQNKLEEMDSYMENVDFDEFAFMKAEIQANCKNAYSYNIHRSILDKRMEAVNQALSSLRELSYLQRTYDEKCKQLDETREERDKIERELRQIESQLRTVRDELVEKIYNWQSNCTLLDISKDTLQEIRMFIEQFDMNQDYSDIRDLIRSTKTQLEEELEKEKRKIGLQLEEQETLIYEKKVELTEWENKKDPIPEECESVRKNRSILKEKGIPFTPFYKAVDFEENLTEERRNQVEEALLDMGILNALIIPASYREEVLNVDLGQADRYIFSDQEHVKKCMEGILEVDNREQDILFYQQVSQALRSIGVDEKHHTCINADGIYQIGAITGIISKEYKAKYIGTKARERYRNLQIESLQTEIKKLEEQACKLKEQYRSYQEKIERVSEEFNLFPSGEDLKLARREYENAVVQLTEKKNVIQRMEEKLRETTVILQEYRKSTFDLCQMAYLPMDYKAGEEIAELFRDYKIQLMDLESTHMKYLDSIARILEQEERLERVEEDEGSIRYDITRYEQNIRGKEGALISVKEQLEATNYEEIKEKLELCIKRLREIPIIIEECNKKEGQLEEKLTTIVESIERLVQQIEEKKGEAEYYKDGFFREYQLGYVEVAIPETLEPFYVPTKVYSILRGEIGPKRQTEILGELQGAFHEKKADLRDYQLTMEHLFYNQEEDNVMIESNTRRDNILSRIDITAKYKGTKIPFNRLVQCLTEELKEQEDLLSDKDRELFEDILANTISKKIRARIHSSNNWVQKMNTLMGSMKTSSGLTLSLRWRSKTAEKEEQLGTKELVDLLNKDSEIMREEDIEKLSSHFRSKIAEARKTQEEVNSDRSFYAIMREILDYRKWFEFQLECKKTNENKRELTDRVFFTFSGGEKAMAMYVPLFSAVVAKYQGAGINAPRMISLDEAFAGVDEMNIKDMFRLMVGFDFNFILNSQILYGDYETVPGLAIYQLVRPENAKFVTVISYQWNGKERVLMQKEA